jgi:autotransporter-associated beta strand protein
MKKIVKYVVIAGGISSPGWAQTTINGNSMALQSSGASAGNGWTLSSDGYIGTYIDLSTAAPVTFTLNASGAASGGLNPDMTLSIADSTQSFNVSSSSLTNYTYTTPTLAAGTYFVRTQLDNQTATQTPSLDVGSLTVAGTGVSVLNSNTSTNALNAATTYATNYRAGPGTISLTNANGIHLGAGTSVQVKLISNSFNFAGAVYGQSPNYEPSSWLNYNANTGVNSAPTSTEQIDYQNAIKANFNMIVPSNAGKWVNDEYTQGSPDMNMVDAMSQFASQNGLRMRMHNLIWNQEQPTYVNNLFASNGTLTSANETTLNNDITSRINYYVSGVNTHTLNTPRTDSYTEMDVLNEPFHGQSAQDNYIGSGALGVSGVANVYAQVAAAVSAAGANTRLYTNEYNVLQFSPQSISSAGVASGSDPYANWYLNGVQGLQRAGAPIGGIGMELYTNASNNVSAVQMQQAMQNLSVAKDPNGNPIALSLTEFGDSSGQIPTVTNYDADLTTALTMAYGDPQTDTFGYWGGIGGPNDQAVTTSGSLSFDSSLYNSSYQLTTTGTVWQNWMNQYSTNLTLTTNTAGQISFNGTYGLYDVIVGGQTYQLNLVKGTTNYGLMTPISTDTWNGAGTDNNWSTTGNWVSGSFAANAPLVFAGTTGLAPNNNSTANTEYDGITFNAGAGAFVIGGNAINLGGDIVNNSTNLQTINTSLTMQTNTNFNAASGDLSIGGAVSGSFSLTKLGTHTLILSGTNIYSGGTAITNGTLRVGAANALPTGTTVTFGSATTNGVLDLNGQSQQVGGLAVAAAVPTASVPLQFIGNSSLTSAATLVFNSTGSSTFGGVIEDAINGGNQTTALVVGGGLLALTGTNTFSGGITIAGGTLQIGATNALPTAATVTFGSATTNGVLDLNGHIQQVGGLVVAAAVPSGSLSSQVIGNSSQTSPATLVFNSTGSSTFGGAIVDAISGGNQITTLNVNGGSLTLTNSNTYSGGTVVTAGRLLIEPTGAPTSALPTGALSISGSGIVQLADNVSSGTPLATSNVNLTSLSLTGSGTLDIGNNRVIIDYSSLATDPIASIATWIQNGFYDLAGPQIISSDIAADDAASGLSYGIGYADGADGLVAGLPSGEIEIMFTLLGDANLDGTVNSEDFTPFSANVGKNGNWDDGDFNYDGTVNSEDFTPFSANLGQSATLAAAAGTLESPDSINLANVPEPASAGLMVVAGLGILRRRRRKSKDFRSTER